MSNVFAKNIELWSKIDPKLAVWLQYLEPNSLKKLPAENPKEAKNWFAHLDLQKVHVLYVYGVGLGYYYEAAKEWLAKDKNRRLVFLEDDLDVLHALLHTQRATEMLQDPQVQLLYFKDLEDTEAVFEVLYWNFAMTRIVVSALRYYEQHKADLYAKLRHKIAYDSAVKNALVDEYLRYGGAFFINFYKNMLSLPGSYQGNKTFGSFRKVPAIICGAGPSLAKNLPKLAKVLDKALVFAGGSALNALNAAGIQPHLGAGIDPNPAQYTRLSSNQAYEVPFYYRNRMYHDAFEEIHGPRLYIPGCGGYDISEYFDERLKLEQEFLDEGHNVINFCLQIAHQLGCNPIVFLGMDLAFTGMKAYAPGVEEDVQFDPNKFTDLDDFDAKPLLLKDIYGEPLYTLWKWVAEADWIGEFAKEHPDTTLINATEGGLGFPDVPNISLDEVVDQHLVRSYPIPDRLQGEIQSSAMPHVTLPKVVKLMLDLRASLQRCVEDFDILLEENASMRGKKGILQSGRAALVETELAEEPAYQYVLEIFNQVQVRLYNRNLQELKNATEKKRLGLKWDLNDKRFTFLRDVARVNVGLIDLALEQKPVKRKKYKGALPDATLPEFKIPDFKPVTLPKLPMEGQKLPSGHMVNVLKQYGKPAEETRLLLDGVLDGQCLLHYPDGKIKAEMFYKQGVLHGPSTYFSAKGAVLAKSFYVDGKLEGTSKWYYLTGAVYAIQRFRKGLLHGKQEYYYADGKPKTLLEYHDGVLQKVDIDPAAV